MAENLDRQNKKLTQSLFRRGIDPNNFVRVQDLIPIVNELEETINSIPIPSQGIIKYKAIISNTGVTQTSGTLVIGEEYIVDTLETGDDFSNVGYVSTGVSFIATGTTPTTWTNGSYVYAITQSAPVIHTVIENTIPGLTVTFGNNGSGSYATLFQTAGLFLAEKTFYTPLNLQRISNNMMTYPPGNHQSVEFEIHP